MEEEKQSSEKLIKIIRSQPNPEEYAEKLLAALESMTTEETSLETGKIV